MRTMSKARVSAMNRWRSWPSKVYPIFEARCLCGWRNREPFANEAVRSGKQHRKKRGWYHIVFVREKNGDLSSLRHDN